MCRTALLVLGLITVGACSDDNAPADRAPDMRPWAAGPPLEASLEATSGDDFFLSWVRDATIDSQGRIYVLDGQEEGLIVFNPDLTYARKIGRAGEGPGEFKYASAVQVLSGDSLLVWDSSLQRITVFAPGSNEAAYIRPLGIQDRGSSVYRLSESAGHIVSFNVTPYMASASNEGETRMIVVRRLYEEAGRVEADSLFEYPVGEAIVVRGEGSVSVSGHPFGQGSFLDIIGGKRVVYAHSQILDVKIIDLAGQAETAFSYETTRIDVTGRELESAADGLGREAATILRQGAPYIWPTLTGMVVDDEDRIWLGITKTDRSMHEWAAFAPDGTHLGSVDVPSELEVYMIRGNRMIGVARDALDVSRIQAYGLPL